MNRISRTCNDLLELLYPSLCITCGERLVLHEKYICMKCWLDLPVTNFHLDPENNVARLFWGRVNIEYATSYFFFRKGSRYQKLIHFIKYRGLKELGFESGIRLGDLLSANYNSVDLIVPVPLHPEKEKRRGFNQSEWIARGIAVSFDHPVVPGNLYRTVYNPTQTRKDRYGRWLNVEGIFKVRDPGRFEGRHIMLVDDVITTGSTLEACAAEILKIPGTRVSIATLAVADM
ncbi:MAG: phosphoribosyltransferase family protein [Prolixibacteraceae bacterium]|nr:phosphoribosyltransferase family protein [Prolixibacteraceae bacterium]MDD4754446.1 phosphoribosyltransferase family protein [Prolixibacteraceae bacterium]NLO03660.1 ComF family protein [Bacteroidales bacterium]